MSGAFALQALGLLVVAVVGAACLRLTGAARRRMRQVGELAAALHPTLRARGRAEGVDGLLAAVQRLVRADEAVLVLVEERPSRTLAAERRGEQAVLLRERHLTRAERSLRAFVQRAGCDVVRSGMRTAEPLAEVLRERGLGHGMAAEMRGERGALALLLVGRRGGRPFGSDERDLLALVAEHACAVLENDRLERSLREVVSLKEELRHRADHDALTGLPNRALFAARVEQATHRAGQGRSARLAVLFLDLDDFKDVNDTLGHQAGDELLEAVGRRLLNTIRPTDLAARLGGDEFAVLVDCVGADDGEQVAERVVAALSTPFRIAGQDVHVHTSIGIAYGRPGQASGDEVLRNADLAMYEAKQSGKRRWARFEPAMEERARRRVELVNALERAAGCGEIGVHYQPIVDLAGGRLVAVEALARWQRPALGLVGASGFVPLADEVGLMSAIGSVVRREACAQVRSWQQLFPEHARLGAAVNLAASELHDPALVDDVRRTLEETGLDPGCLTLELTESGVMLDPDTTLRRMRELRELGVSLALDDFGTGHSSLAHLRAFPLDVLKIAAPLVKGIGDGDRDVAFVETIVRLGSSLDLAVVAEGIESRAQATAARALACDRGQGFHFGRPLAPLGITAYLSAERLPVVAPGFSSAA